MMAGPRRFACFLWSTLPGAIARALPANWHVPEWLSPRAPLEIADIYLGMLNAFSAPAELSEDEAAPLIAAFADRIVDILLRGRAAW